MKLFTLQCPSCGYVEKVEKLMYSSKVCVYCQTPLERIPLTINCLHSDRIKLSNGKTMCRRCRKVFDRDGNEISLDEVTAPKKNSRAW